MGPFSSNSFLVKTIAYGRSRPTTSTSIQIPFNLLSRSIQVMRQSGITVTAITNVDSLGETNQSDAKKVMGEYFPKSRYFMKNQVESFFPCLTD